jgi:pyruvate kinase
MDVARLNFSHGTHADHAQTIADIRALADKLNRPVAVLQDLAGPKIRTGPVASGQVMLVAGQALTLTSRDVPGDAKEISLTCKDLPKEVRAGDTLLLSDGALELTVRKVAGQDIVCQVVTGGLLGSHKGINLITRMLDVPILTEKDRRDLTFGLSQGVDYIAVSFVRTASDILQVRRLIHDAGQNTPLIAKIEQREAIENLDAIMKVVDGIMVARGDLGVEIPPENVPEIQKRIISKANQAGKPVITATQMLKSMVENPHPTRAEVSDVANAILDGSDAIMLSEETAVGRHPIAAVRIMSRIAERAEGMFPFETWHTYGQSPGQLSPEEGVALAACQLARGIDAAAIVTLTQSGSTTRLVAKYRPARPILAMTPEMSTHSKLALIWGTTPFLIESTDEMIQIEQQALRVAAEAGCVQPGQLVVLTAGLPLHMPGTTNLIRIHRAE